MRKVIILLIIISLIGLIGCGRYEIYDESEPDNTPVGQALPQWINLEIIGSDSALFVELGKPVEITAKIQPLIGDMEKGYFLFELPKGIELLEGNKYSEPDFYLKEKELFEAKIKVVAKEPFERDWITFTVGSDFPAQAVRGAVIREQGRESLNILEGKILRWEELGFQSYDTIEVKKLKEVLYNIIKLYAIECWGCGSDIVLVGSIFLDNSSKELDDFATLAHTSNGIALECLESYKEKTTERKEETDFGLIDENLLTKEEIKTLKECIKELDGIDYCKDTIDCCEGYPNEATCDMQCIKDSCVPI